MTLLIRGGTVVNADMSRRADVLVEGERIVAVGEDLDAPAGAEVVDAGGALVMPGGVDPHTHLEFAFMGTVSADDFEWGTKAALAGGTTTVIDFCIPGAGQGMIDAYREWRAKSEKAAGDYSYHVAVTGWSDDTAREMGELVEAHGVTSFKHFMAYKGALMVDDDVLFRSFKRCAGLGALALVHAENGDVVAQMQEDFIGRGLTGPEFHAYSRPPEVEGEAANRAIMIAEMAGCALYIVHTSCIPAHDAIKRARARGQRVFGEPLIQHLTLDETDYLDQDWDHAAQRVMSPPFRPKAHQDSLWAGLQSGSLQVVATDHCSFSIEQKRLGRQDFRVIPNGTGGLEDRMPMLWTAGVGTGRLTPNEFVAATSANAAQIYGLYPQKGIVMPGADADLLIWDPTATKTIAAKTQVSRIEYNVFEGRALTGLPVKVYARGRLAVEHGDIRAERGQGRFIPRKPQAYAQAIRSWKAGTAPHAVVRQG